MRYIIFKQARGEPVSRAGAFNSCAVCSHDADPRTAPPLAELAKQLKNYSRSTGAIITAANAVLQQVGMEAEAGGGKSSPTTFPCAPDLWAQAHGAARVREARRAGAGTGMVQRAPSLYKYVTFISSSWSCGKTAWCRKSRPAWCCATRCQPRSWRQ